MQRTGTSCLIGKDVGHKGKCLMQGDYTSKSVEFHMGSQLKNKKSVLVKSLPPLLCICLRKVSFWGSECKTQGVKELAQNKLFEGLLNISYLPTSSS